MKKKQFKIVSVLNKAWKSKLFVMMRITLFVILISVFQGYSESLYGQGKSLRLKMENTTLRQVLSQIENQTDYFFMYNGKLVNVDQKVSVDIENKNIDNTLKELFKNSNITFEIKDRQILLFRSTASISALQQKTIKGKVTDSENQPLPGVTVVIKGTMKGTITDIDGNYSIANVPANSILQFSFVGMENQDVKIGNQAVIDISMQAKATDIDDVVVIGYAAVERKKVLGAVSGVKSKDIEQSTPTGAFDAVQGKLSGVQILTNGGPGDGYDISVRGVSTFGSGTTPLYVVDGQQLDDIDNLDPNDIASMEVLKDGATAAIYGSKAANGVVLITTKKATAGKLKVDINAVSGFSSLVGDLALANTAQRIEYEKLRSSNYDTMTSLERDSLSLLMRNSYDLQDMITRTAIRQQYNVAISGGSEKGRFYWNTGYMNEKGIVISSDYTRFSNLLKIDANPLKVLSVGTKLNLTYEDQNGISVSGIFTHLIARIPYYPIYEPDGSYSPTIYGRKNPLAQADLKTKRDRKYRVQSFSYAQLDLLPNLKFKSTIGVNFMYRKRNDFTPSICQNNEASPTGELRTYMDYDIQHEDFLNYKNSWGKSHLVSYIGLQIQKYYIENFDISGTFISDDIQTFNNSDSDLTNIVTSGTQDERHNMFSLFTGFNYDYNDTYLIGATLRRDGSSRFGDNKKYGYFPSCSIGWRLSNENFMKQFDVINNLLLRFSFGKVGNERIDNYESTSSLMPGSNYTGSGVSQTSLGNPDLGWESTSSTNIGVDLDLFKNRFNLSFELWKKNTDDLLTSVSLPEESGFSSITKNEGSVENKGIDITVGGTVVKTRDFRWNSSFNISFLRNKVTELSNGTPFMSGDYKIEEGQPIGNVYGYKNLGVYQYTESNAYARNDDGELVRLTPTFDIGGTFLKYTLNGEEYQGEVTKMKVSGTTLEGGDYIWEDLNNDGNITAADDKEVIGNGLSTCSGGWTNSFSYKGFKLSVLFDYTLGFDIYKRYDEARNDLNSSGETPSPIYIENCWKNEGDVTVWPRMIRVSQQRLSPNSFYIEEGDYVKLRNIRLNYTIPHRILQSVRGVSNVDLSFSVKNVLTWTNYGGYNPELGRQGSTLKPGYDNLRYPNNREFILGLKIQLQ